MHLDRIGKDDLPPLVTIITPVYNQSGYLAETIESVLAQSYPSVEYIVIDDGSSDDSLAVARSYEDRGVKVLSQVNSGQAATLNRGWALANGEYLAYLSSDDRLLPDAVSSMVRALQSTTHATVAYCDFWLIDAAGRRLRESQTEDYNFQRLSVDLICQPGPGAIFRRLVFDQTGGWNEALHQVPDFEFWLRASWYGEFVRVPQALAEYRIHEGSASFKAMTIQRSEEIVQVVQSYWATDDALGLSAYARAFLLASKNHAQSGRTLKALQFFGHALKLRPMLIMELSIWRQLLVGLLRRGYYQNRATRT